jgi:hypothetical protein
MVYPSVSGLQEFGIQHAKPLHSPTPAQFLERNIPIPELVESVVPAQNLIIESEFE